MKMYYVDYQISSYRGTVIVYSESSTETCDIINQAKKILFRNAGVSFPLGINSFTVRDQ